MNRWRPSFTTLSAVALVIGLAGGLVAQALHSAPLLALASWLAPIGELWIKAIRMTVIPIVLTSVVVAIAGSVDARAVGRLGVLSLATFVVLLLLGGVLTALVMPSILGAFPPGSLSFGVPRVPVAAPAAGAPMSLVDWLLGLVPVNPFQASAAGDILPLLVFTVPFAIALTRIRPEQRQSVVAVARGVSEALFVMLRWFLWIGPLAVFCLTYDLTARTGVTGLGTVGAFVAIVSALLIGFTLLLYPIAMLVGRVSLARFVRATREAQIIGATTRSSMAALPALLQGIERHLGLAPTVNAFVTPLAVASFRLSQTLSGAAKLLFLAYVYGVPLGPLQIGIFVATVTLLSFATPGLPSTGSVKSIPLYIALGIPLEGVIILNAVDVIPDIFKTLMNVTAQATATAVVARHSGMGVETAGAIPAAMAVEKG